MISDWINCIPGIDGLRYLELGLGRGATFARVRSLEKYSVDINGRADFTGTTDRFFAEDGRRWDVILVDADHDFPQVLRDFNHAAGRCDLWVLLHDMVPPSSRFTQSRFCSDSFRLLYHFVAETGLQVYPTVERFGLTFVRMPAEPVAPGPDIASVSYEQFRAVAFHRYSMDEMRRILG